MCVVVQINRVATIGFFWSYIIIVVFIMYNMVVAIILVVFQEQNEKRKQMKSNVISAFLMNKLTDKDHPKNS